MIPTLGYKNVEKVMLHEFDFQNPRNLICPSSDLAGKERKKERRKREREERQTASPQGSTARQKERLTKLRAQKKSCYLFGTSSGQV